MDRFVAFDLETANVESTSICEVAFVKFDQFREDGDYPTLYTLVRPAGDFRVDFANTSVHGLTQADLLEAPLLSEVWDEIEDFLEDLPLVAHGATQDINKLIATLKTQGMTMRDRDFYCSLVMARNIPDVLSENPFTLGNLADLAGVDWFEVERPNGNIGHHAVIDAAACRGIASAYLEKYSGSFQNLLRELGLREGKVVSGAVFHGNTKIPQNTFFSRFTQYNETTFEQRKGELSSHGFHISNSSYLFEKNVVLTLELENLTTNEFWDAVALAGGHFKSGISKKVDVLVEGSIDSAGRYLPGESKKSVQAREFLESGKSKIQILREQDFCNLVGSEILQLVKEISNRKI